MKKKKKSIKHKPDKFSFFNLFRSFSASNTSLDGIVDLHELLMPVESELNKTENMRLKKKKNGNEETNK
jgi:hypothetical protein